MTIEEKVTAVMKIYDRVDADVYEFQKQSGLACLRPCSRCCTYPHITATPLEALPLAYWLYQKHWCEDWLTRLKKKPGNEPENQPHCLFLEFPADNPNPQEHPEHPELPEILENREHMEHLDNPANWDYRESGLCIAYPQRPLVCRLFGFSAVLNKNSLPQLVTCRMIKTLFKEKYLETLRSLETLPVPIMKNYSLMMYSIDFALAQQYYPLNEALRLAIEKVLTYFSYAS